MGSFQIALKVLTLPDSPIGIDELRASGAIPRQLYDLDHLFALVSEDEWSTTVSGSATALATSAA